LLQQAPEDEAHIKLAAARAEVQKKEEIARLAIERARAEAQRFNDQMNPNPQTAAMSQPQYHHVLQKCKQPVAARCGWPFGRIKSMPQTSLRITNIPENYDRQMLLDLLNSFGLEGFYDFVYLPMKFVHDVIVVSFGYAYVNGVSQQHAEEIMRCLSGYLETAWVPAEMQGLAAHVETYRNHPVMHPSVPKKFKPLLFINGVATDLPEPTMEVRAPRLGAQY
jgi:hypothetical protein